MDYVFFAFSAMCLGLAVWLAVQGGARGERRPRLWHFILAGLVAALYFFLQTNVFQNNQTLLYLANMLPQLLLLLELAFLLYRKPRH
jgi:hypothetical protein